MRLRSGVAVWAVVALGAVAAVAPPARAAKYELFVDIETEEDLYDLLADGLIEQDTFDTLLELYQRGVKLNTATREELYTLPNLTYREVDGILAYRDEVGWIDDPAALVSAGVLTDRRLLAIAPFLILGKRKGDALATDGRVLFGTRWSSEDARVPPMELRARLSTLRDLTVGVAATLTRNRLGEVVYEPNRVALAAEAPAPRVHVPKAFAHYDTDKLDVILGTYRIGFGQRLTFDNTSQYTPNGIYLDNELSRDTDLERECKEARGELADTPCPGDVPRRYITPDYKWRDALLGAAVGLKHLELGKGHLQAYGFLSHQPRSIYYTSLYNTATCDDPHDDADGCRAPDVYHLGDDPLAAATEFSYHTLPDMFVQDTVGANATYFIGRQVHFGMTGYTSSVSWLTEGIDLDFQDSYSLPYGGRFGAVGFDMAWGHSWLDVFMEAAYSFDSMPESDVARGGGGPAVIVRSTATWKKREVEASFRYYDKNFANPHARAINDGDLFDGLRARDEVGLRLRYSGLHKKRLDLRAHSDIWVRPSLDLLKTYTYVRSDIEVSKLFRWGLWAEYRDKDLGRTGTLDCTGSISEVDTGTDREVSCEAQKLKLTGRLRYAPTKQYSIAAEVQHSSIDFAYLNADIRQDIGAAVVGNVKVGDALRARLRLRYIFEDIADNQHLEQFLWGYLDLRYRLGKRKDFVRIRYDLRVWLDDRDSTALRVPSPEHWLWLELESRF